MKYTNTETQTAATHLKFANTIISQTDTPGCRPETTSVGLWQSDQWLWLWQSDHDCGSDCGLPSVGTGLSLCAQCKCATASRYRGEKCCCRASRQWGASPRRSAWDHVSTLASIVLDWPTGTWTWTCQTVEATGNIAPSHRPSSDGRPPWVMTLMMTLFGPSPLHLSNWTLQFSIVPLLSGRRGLGYLSYGWV